MQICKDCRQEHALAACSVHAPCCGATCVHIVHGKLPLKRRRKR